MAKPTSYLGVDLGGSSLKIVELKSVNNRPQLVTYGLIDETYNIIKDDSASARAEVARHLKELTKSSRVSTDKVVSALPSYSVFSSIISLPAMSKKELISAVRWEAKKFVPIPLEEMILDWEVLEQGESAEDTRGEQAAEDAHDDEAEEKAAEEDSDKDQKKKKPSMSSGDKKSIKVLLTAAPKNLVNRYVEVFKQVDLQLVGLETESFALERCLIGNDSSPIMIIDIGNNATSIIIFSGGVPILNRSIDVGGASISNKLVEVMGLNQEQAEQYKRDMGTSMAGQKISDLPQPVAHVVNSVINEIRYILNIYQNQNRQHIKKIILTGGSAFLANLTENIEDVFNIKSFVGDPWARVVHPVEIDGLLKGLGPRMSVSIGLAMREIS